MGEPFLKGLKVIDLTRLLPGPFATMLLADMGAEVIKVEDPGPGDYARYFPPIVGSSSAFFQSLNRNKRSVTLDLKDKRDQARLKTLLAGADVLIESFRPGVMARLGLDPKKLRQEFPRLVICSITGYGQTGPLKERAGHDANFLAYAGILAMNGPADAGPTLPGFQLADIAGGALYGALGITSALLRRYRTEQGAHLDISMTEGALSFMIPTIARQRAGEVEERGQGMLTGGLPGYRIYQTADGRYLAVAALEPKFWDPFVEAIGAPDLKGKGVLTGEAGQEVARQLARIIGGRTFQNWSELLKNLDVCVEPIWSLDEILESELHRARQIFFELNGVTHLRTPLTPVDMKHEPAPEKGAHNDEIFGTKSD